MLLNAVIIVLREVIEASLLISVFLAYGQRYQKPQWQLLLALALGLIGGAVYAINIVTLSQWFDGVGQEVVNASLQLLIYMMLLLFVMTALQPQSQRYNLWVMRLMLGIIALATIRESSEVMLYLHGFMAVPDLIQPVILGGTIGAGIGISIGIFIYYWLVTMSIKRGTWVAFLIILLVAGGMISQSIQLLTQADWIESTYPVWDTSMYIGERSIAGQLLYALIGYEATPTYIQALSYFSSLMLMIGVAIMSHVNYLRSR